MNALDIDVYSRSELSLFKYPISPNTTVNMIEADFYVENVSGNVVIAQLFGGNRT